VTASVLVVGEDDLCCALGVRLVGVCLSGWSFRFISIGGVTKLWPRIAKYQQYAQNVYPVLCIADTDGKCVRHILAQRLSQPGNARFLFRLAVIEAESWVLADREGFAQAFGIPVKKLPYCPDNEADPKGQILTLMQKFGRRVLRQEIVNSIGPCKPGPGYNPHLCSFVREKWNADRVAETSPSLMRAMLRLKKSGAQWLNS
jgi:hypothetical protein